jgi:acyl carrier protein
MTRQQDFESAVSLSRQDLVAFFQERFSLDVSVMADDDALFSSGLLDSLSIVEVVAFLEERTGTTLLPDDLSFDNFDSVARILRFARVLEGRQS